MKSRWAKDFRPCSWRRGYGGPLPAVHGDVACCEDIELGLALEESGEIGEGEGSDRHRCPVRPDLHPSLERVAARGGERTTRVWDVEQRREILSAGRLS